VPFFMLLTSRAWPLVTQISPLPVTFVTVIRSEDSYTLTLGKSFFSAVIREEVMKVRLMLCFAAVLIATMVQAQEKTIKHVPAKPTSAASGQEMFVSYCAVCHGKDGKGAGPAADALKVPPTDLTTLTKKNNGQYPSMHVATVIRGDAELPAHGNKEMPVWGPLFMQMSQGHEAEVQQRVSNLDHYIESLQAK